MKTAVEVGNEMLSSRPLRELTIGEAKVLTMLFLANKAGVPYTLTEQDPEQAKILAKRLDWAKVPYEYDAAFWLASCADRVGTVILYAAAIAAVAAQKNDGSAVTLDDMVLAFGDGMPTEEALHKVWLGQKGSGGRGGNWLDTAAAWGLTTEAA